MLNFFPSSWDLFFVYRNDFLREIDHIVTDGTDGITIGVCPVVDLAHVSSDVWGDFRWQSDRAYRNFVQIAAIIFVAIVASTRTETTKVSIPQWLALDVAAVAATFTPASRKARAIQALKDTAVASQQNRRADPLMMLQVTRSLGLGDTKSFSDFINQYNSTVYYNSSLALNPRLGSRLFKLS